MLNFNSNTTTIATRDNTLSINGTDLFKLSDNEAKYVIDLVQKLLNGQSVNKEEPKQGLVFGDEEAFPKYQGSEKVGKATFYDSMLGVRTWEWRGTKPDTWRGTEKEWRKSKTEQLKKDIRDAGGKWDDEKKIYVFSTKKAYTAFKKAQIKGFEEWKKAQENK